MPPILDITHGETILVHKVVSNLANAVIRKRIPAPILVD